MFDSRNNDYILLCTSPTDSILCTSPTDSMKSNTVTIGDSLGNYTFYTPPAFLTHNKESIWNGDRRIQKQTNNN